MRVCEPSERNFGIFCAVEFDGQSLRKVAEQNGISPTRVQQIVEQVRNWFTATTPEWVQQKNPRLQPFIACRYHHERLAYYISELMSGWRASQGEVTVKHQRGGDLGVASSTTRPSYGEGRYLLQAARLSQMQIDAAVRLAKIAQKFELPEETDTVIAHEETASPCALEAPQAAGEVTSPAEDQSLNTLPDETYDDAVNELPAAERELPCCPTPVRSRLERKLTRQQRRKAARQKQREKALA